MQLVCDGRGCHSQKARMEGPSFPLASRLPCPAHGCPLFSNCSSSSPSSWPSMVHRKQGLGCYRQPLPSPGDGALGSVAAPFLASAPSLAARLMALEWRRSKWPAGKLLAGGGEGGGGGGGEPSSTEHAAGARKPSGLMDIGL